MEELKSMSDLFDDSIYDSISLEKCVADRKVIGGPAPEAVKLQIADLKKYFSEK